MLVISLSLSLTSKTKATTKDSVKQHNCCPYKQNIQAYRSIHEGKSHKRYKTTENSILPCNTQRWLVVRLAVLGPPT